MVFLGGFTAFLLVFLLASWGVFGELPTFEELENPEKNLATEVNTTVENIGARRLHTIIERVLDDISFTATDNSGKTITVNSDYVKKNLGELVKDTDLSRFIL